MPDEPSRSHGPHTESGLSHGDGPREYAVTPGDLDGDDWDQDAAMAAFMADLESGYDLFTASIGLDPDPGDTDWLPPDEPPSGGTGLGWSAAGRGFGSGDALDTALPDPVLAGHVDAAAGQTRDYAGLDDDAVIGALRAWQKVEAWAASGKLSAAAELIRRRPAVPSGDPGTADGPTVGPSVIPWDTPGAKDGAPGGHADDTGAAGSSAPDARRGPGGSVAAAGTSPGRRIPAEWGKFCADELAVALSISRWVAERTLALAHDLATRLPLTARALREGVIDLYKAQIIAEATRVLDDAATAAAEAAILGAGIEGKTPGQIRATAGRAVLKADPTAARKRREQAQKDARVELWREDAGTAALCGFGLPPDAALAADQRIRDRTADLKAAGVPGTMDQLRVRAYLDALLGQDTAAATRAATAAAAAGQNGAAAVGRDPRDSSGPGQTGPGTASGPAGGTSRPADGPPAGPGTGAPVGMAAQINLTIPLATLLGLAERPGEAAGFGPIDADLARAIAANAAAHPATSWCLTVTDQQGHPAAHGCARPTRPPRAPRRPDPGGGTPGPPPAPPGPPGPPAGPPRPPSPGPPGGGTGTPARPSGPPGTPPAPTAPARPPGGSTPASNPGPPGAGRPRGPRQDRANSANSANSGNSGNSGYGSWRLRPAPGGPDLRIDLEPLAVTGCDHRHRTRGHDPGDTLRHLIHIRDGECTWPPCRRNARRCDFEHAIPWETGGPTCACNAGARCRHHHHQKQAHGWTLTQHLPGYHTWTTPAGRTYTNGPATYPV